MSNTITVKRIRGRALQRIREQLMWHNPLCHGPDSECQKAKRITLWVELDHIKPLHKGGTDTPDNRQGLCEPCHKAKTQRDMGYTMKTLVGLDGYPIEKR